MGLQSPPYIRKNYSYDPSECIHKMGFSIVDKCIVLGLRWRCAFHFFFTFCKEMLDKYRARPPYHHDCRFNNKNNAVNRDSPGAIRFLLLSISGDVEGIGRKSHCVWNEHYKFLSEEDKFNVFTCNNWNSSLKRIGNSVKTLSILPSP